LAVRSFLAVAVVTLAVVFTNAVFTATCAVLLAFTIFMASVSAATSETETKCQSANNGK